jgi:GDPmannose 4,6-dehydratase
VKKALIVGARGQDGRLLTDYLLQEKYDVLGVARDQVFRAGTMEQLTKSVNIESFEEVRHLVDELCPDEIYYLAAYHHSAEDLVVDEKSLFERSQTVNLTGLVNFLETLRQISPQTKLFYAASSHIFGNVSEGQLQDETTPIAPSCIYGITKAAGLFSCQYYRNKYSLFASTGILYNHESKYRHERFLSRRITSGLARIKRGEISELALGNLDARIDWGFAPDYVRAMSAILGAKAPDDFIVASGIAHTVRDFVAIAFSLCGLKWESYIVENPRIVKKADVFRIGNPEKLKRLTGWQPQYSFEDMIRVMLQEEGII